jgi:lysophospholipase L1-like esterase
MRDLAVVAAALCLWLASCGGSSSTPHVQAPVPKTPTVGKLGLIAKSYTGSGPKVAIIGDSLTVLEWNDLYSSLDRHYAVEIGAFFGEGYNPGKFSQALHLSPPLLVQTAHTYAASHPSVAVLALGTNDAWNRRSTPKALAAMATMIAGFKGACLVGITLPENSTVKGWSNTEAHSLNVAMRKWANQVVDWASMSAAPAVLGAGGVHTTAKGTNLRADAIIAAVKRCGRKSN